MVDVTVMGAGAFGLSVAWACVSRGASVRVIDPNGIGAGASGGVVGALAPHAPERWTSKKEFQFQSLIMAQSFWADVEAAGGLTAGYGRTGRLQPIMTDRGLALAHARAECAKEVWQGQAHWTVIPQDRMGSWAPVSPTGMYILDTLTARMHPRQACAALAAAIQAKGGDITSSGPEQGQVVWATGWRGLEALSLEIGQVVGGGEKGQAALLDHARPDVPQIYADSVHIVPHADGTIAIGSTTERYFDDPAATDSQIDDVVARACAVVPELAGAKVIERWAGVRPRTKSRAPVLGHHPVRDGQFITNGGFKIGFGIAPKVAELMADLVLEGRDAIPEAFKPESALFDR